MTTRMAGGDFQLQVTLSMRNFNSTAFGYFYVTGSITRKQELNQFINIQNNNGATVEKAKFQPGSMLGALIKLKQGGSPRTNKM